MYLTLHSYSQMWLLPWSHTRTKSSDYSDMINVAKKAINAIAKVHGTHYQLGPMTDLMYPISGRYIFIYYLQHIYFSILICGLSIWIGDRSDVSNFW